MPRSSWQRPDLRRPGDDKLSGAEGNDRIDGETGIDTLEGGPGADILRLGPNILKEVYKGEGSISFYDNAKGGPGDDVISGGEGPDQIDGGAGNDRLHGGSGDDQITGGLGDDIAYGGSGSDAWYAGETVDGEIDRFYGGTGGDDVVRLAGDVARGRQILHGESGDDSLGGGSGDDLIVGGSGDDLLYAGEGDDDVRGGTGIDTVDYAQGGVGSQETQTADYPKLHVDLQMGKATGLGEDRLSSVEGVIGGTNVDVLLGSRDDNIFYLSELPDDLPEGQTVEDVIDGRGGHDTIRPSYFACCGITVDLAKRSAKEFAGASARLRSIEGAIGTYWDDDLRGDDGPNTFRGLGGADLIRGRGGPDRIWGDKGVEGSAADRLYGGAGADTIYGGLGPDRIYGGSGRDRLYGGPGRDRLDGGTGRDRCLSPSTGLRARSCELP